MPECCHAYCHSHKPSKGQQYKLHLLQQDNRIVTPGCPPRSRSYWLTIYHMTTGSLRCQQFHLISLSVWAWPAALQKRTQKQKITCHYKYYKIIGRLGSVQHRTQAMQSKIYKKKTKKQNKTKKTKKKQSESPPSYQHYCALATHWTHRPVHFPIILTNRLCLTEEPNYCQKNNTTHLTTEKTKS